MKEPHDVLFTQAPLAQLAISFAGGIVVANQFSLRLKPLIIAAAFLTFAAGLAVLFRRHRVCGFMLLLPMLVLGASAQALEQRTTPTNSLKFLLASENVGAREAVSVTGLLYEPPSFARDRVYLNLRVEGVSLNQTQRAVSGVINVLAVFRNAEQEQSYRKLNLRYGDRLKLIVTLRRNDQFRNPGVSRLSDFLEQKGWDAVGLLKSPGEVTRISAGSGFTPLGWIYDWRQKLQSLIDERFNVETAGVLDATLLGNRYNLTPEVTERFRAGGTFHVLVISGFHISFLGGLVYLLARRLTQNRYAQFVLSVIVVWAYSLAVGGDPSVVRAALMFTLITLANVIFRPSSSLNALGASAFLILLYRPGDLFDPSFQLTFLSVLAIISLALPVIQKLKATGQWYPTRSAPYPPNCSRLLKSFSEALFWSERIWQAELKRSPHHYRLVKSKTAVLLERYRMQAALRYIFCAVVISLSVQLMLLPLMIVYFHRVSLSAVVLNIGVSALLALLTILATLALILALFSGTLAAPVVLAADFVNSVMVQTVVPFTLVGLDSIRLPEYSAALRSTYVLYYLPLVFVLMGISRWNPLGRPLTNPSPNARFKAAALLQLILVVTLLLHPWSQPRADGRVHVDFLDVGQGDSALVTMPDGTTLLVDGGGRPNFFQSTGDQKPAPVQRSIGETVVSEYLWWRGLDRVDYVLATHADADHIDGLNDVIKNFSVRSAIVARIPANDPEFAHFAETLRTMRVPLTTVQAGDMLAFGPVSAEVLSPIAIGESSGNDDSLVLRVKFGERAILLTGDIEKRAETLLVNSGRELKADVVKVPHHGSRTSSTEPFVTSTGASVSIISVGLTSMFGHPHKEVVERWKLHGAQVLTTGQCGTISVSSDGRDLRIEKYVPC